MNNRLFKRLKSSWSSIAVLLFLLLIITQFSSALKGERRRGRKVAVERASDGAFGLFVNLWGTSDDVDVEEGSGGGGGFTSIFSDIFDSESGVKIKNYHSMEDDNLSDLDR